MTTGKKKGFLGTAFLAVLAIAFGAYIYFIEIKKTEKDAKSKEESEKLFAVEADQVKAIEIQNKSGLIKLEKDDKGWRITQPVNDLADEPTVTGFLGGLTPEKYEQVVSETPSEFATYGLEKPQAFIALTTKDGKRKQVNIGIEAAIPGKLYVQPPEGGKVVLGNANVKFQSEKSVKDLRDKKIFRGSKDEVQSITLTYAKGEKYEFTRDKERWNLRTKNGKLEVADQDSVQKLLDVVDGLKAQEVISEKSIKPEKTDIEIVLMDKDKKKLEAIHFTLGKEKVNAQVESRPQVYSIYQASVQPLEFKDPLLNREGVFRDKKAPFAFDKDNVNEIVLKTSLADVHLVKKGSNWEQAKPDDKKEVSQIQVSGFLDKLSQFKVNEFVSGQTPKGLNPPKGSVVLKDAKGQVVFSTEWGDKTKSQKTYFVRTSKGGEIYGIDNSVIDTMPAQTLVESKETKKTDVKTAKEHLPPDEHDEHDH